MMVRRTVSRRYVFSSWLIAVLMVSIVGQPGHVKAQDFPVLFLPATRSVTYYANAIDAQARWMAANGYQQMAIAKARQMHADATSMEMDNAIKWVHTYFQRKELNREYRRKLNPTYRQRVQKADQLKHSILKSTPEFVFKGDVTNEMNWMLDRLSTLALTHAMFYGEEAPAGNADVNDAIAAQTLAHLNFSKGERIEGHELTFRAASGAAFKSEWPLVLLDEVFQANRVRFEQARDDIIGEARQTVSSGKTGNSSTQRALVELETWKYLQFAVDKLSSQLLQVYPWERRREPREYFRYKSGERFLKAQAAVIVHAMTTNDVGVLGGDYKFEGTTVYELIHHMCRQGLKFAPPLAGDKDAYRKMFLDMRQVYLHHRPDVGDPVDMPNQDPGGGQNNLF